MEDSILKKRLSEHISVANAILNDPKIHSQIELVVKKILESYKKGGKVIFMGNGGSAADAQHMAAELVGRYLKERKALPAIALTTNTSVLTAIGNDYGYEKTFIRQLEAIATKNDIVIGLSTSGNSLNVVEAFYYAKREGIFCVALTGSKKCKLDEVADVSIKVPSENTPRIQEMHQFLLHTICEIIESLI